MIDPVIAATEWRMRMTAQDRIESLKAKHANLETAIEEENSRPCPDFLALHELKRQKLRIKDEIARISSG